MRPHDTFKQLPPQSVRIPAPPNSTRQGGISEQQKISWFVLLLAVVSCCYLFLEAEGIVFGSCAGSEKYSIFEKRAGSLRDDGPAFECGFVAGVLNLRSGDTFRKRFCVSYFIYGQESEHLSLFFLQSSPPTLPLPLGCCTHDNVGVFFAFTLFLFLRHKRK